MFSYFTATIVLIFLGYAVIFPLLLWITPLKAIDRGFYRFNLGLCCIIGALGIISYHFIAKSLSSEIYLLIWLSLMMFITAMNWNSKTINNYIISAISVIGCIIIAIIIPSIVPSVNPIGALIITLLNSTITATVFFSMILGHWYLNIVALPIRLLKRSIIIFSFFLSIRILWDSIYFVMNNYIDNYGMSYNLWSFMFQFDGFLLGIAFFIGNLFPVALNVLIWRTIKLQATQSATGLLYVSVVSILFSDLILKYYLLEYGFIV